MRQDLPLQHQLVQSNHAVLTLASREKIDGIPNIILVGVNSREHLARVQAKLVAHGIDHCAWHEPDCDMGFTSICTVPLDAERKKALAHYRLWRSLPGSSTGRAPEGLTVGG